MVLGVILTVLLGTVTIGAVSEPSEPTPQVREYYGPGDYGNYGLIFSYDLTQRLLIEEETYC